jgi:hypothetical protein
MARISHKQKVMIATNLMTDIERRRGAPLFGTAGWEARKSRIIRKMIKDQAIAKDQAAERRAKKKEAANA